MYKFGILSETPFTVLSATLWFIFK